PFAASVSPNRLKKRHPERVGAVEAEFFNGLLAFLNAKNRSSSAKSSQEPIAFRVIGYGPYLVIFSAMLRQASTMLAG
ncbi:hypothetical protein, partial [Stutzerimonas balearica]|uniref:hypothetical protein n=1 Tax=Stutzerimonas balearica TaxID=74829 RepID=UPI00384F420E